MLNLSVLVPTYNRLPILKKCLAALLDQSISQTLYEIIVVDDGSTDGTDQWLHDMQNDHGKLCVLRSAENKGRVHARNMAVQSADTDLVLFVDSDVVVSPHCLEEHIKTHQQHGANVICQGSLILTPNFENPLSEPWHLWTDFSRAFFATGNVSVSLQAIIQAGSFDEAFNQYGWEDLELGLRLKKQGLKLIRNRKALGFHWEPPFQTENLPIMIAKEKARAIGAVYFHHKHPTLEVKMMTQLTWFHQLIDRVINSGDEQQWLNLIRKCQQRGWNSLAIALARMVVNHHYMCTLKAHAKDVF